MVKCHVFGSMENRIKNPGPIDQILLRREIKKQLPQEYAHLKDQVKEGILSSSKNLSTQQINSIVKEAKNERQS